jgi:hypothetical protein
MLSNGVRASQRALLLARTHVMLPPGPEYILQLEGADGVTRWHQTLPSAAADLFGRGRCRPRAQSMQGTITSSDPCCKATRDTCSRVCMSIYH